MWFILSVLALLCWSGSDLFSKIGSRPDDRYSHWKMVMAVGLVMGLHAIYEITLGGVKITLSDILTYLPASALYIISMIFGYVSLRYIELSISSPICNSSGSISAVLCILFLGQETSLPVILAIGIVAVGVIMLGVVNMTEDDELRELRQQESNVKYTKSLWALLLPIIYCVVDALGTFIDAFILREEPTGTALDNLFTKTLSEDTANVAYELTFLMMGILAAVYVLVIKREKIFIKRDAPKLVGGIFETAGQFAYIFALGDTAHVAAAAAIISSYCALSTLWSRIFLKEKLTVKHYSAIAVVVVGIVIMGIYDI